MKIISIEWVFSRSRSRFYQIANGVRFADVFLGFTRVLFDFRRVLLALFALLLLFVASH